MEGSAPGGIRVASLNDSTLSYTPSIVVVVVVVVVVFAAFSHRHNAVRGHKTGSNNFRVEEYLGKKNTNKNTKTKCKAPARQKILQRILVLLYTQFKPLVYQKPTGTYYSIVQGGFRGRRADARLRLRACL